MIGLITLAKKHAGKRSAGNPHAPFNAAGAGTVAWSRSCDTRRRKGEQRGTQTSTYTGAPVLDPTAKHLDDSIKALGVEVLRSPVASPKANALCERVIGTARRECLDWLIPLSEAHLRAILKCWVTKQRTSS